MFLASLSQIISNRLKTPVLPPVARNEAVCTSPDNQELRNMLSKNGILSPLGLCRLVAFSLLIANVGCMAGNGWALNRSGMRQYARGHYALARNRFARAIAHDPCNPDFRHNLAMALQKQGDQMACERILRHNLTIDAMHQPTYHSLAQMLVNQGRTSDAQDLLAGWVATQPYIPEANIEMAWLQKQNGDIPGAEASLQMALKTRPGHPVALSQLGQLYQSQGQNELAATYYQRSLASNWDQPEVQSRLATLTDPQFKTSRSALMQNSTSMPLMADASAFSTDDFISNGPVLNSNPTMVSYSTPIADPMLAGAPMLASDPSFQQPIMANQFPTMAMTPPANIEVPFGTDNDVLALEEISSNPEPKRVHRKKGKRQDPMITSYPLPNFDAPSSAWVPSGSMPGQPATAYQSPSGFQPPMIGSDLSPIPVVGGPTPINGNPAALTPQADPAHFYGPAEMTASLPVVDPH